MVSDEFSERELRDFIYLNDESINSHLSSLGVGLETNRREGSVQETESQGRFAALVPAPFGLIGGNAERRKSSRDNSEKEIDVTVPYRFQELIRQINEKDDAEIKDLDEDNVRYGDVVYASGMVEPMSLFRFEIAQDANLTLQRAAIEAREELEAFHEMVRDEFGPDSIPEEFSEADDDSDDHPIGISKGRVGVGDKFSRVVEAVTGERVPIRLDTNNTSDQSYGAVLDRNQIRVPLTRAFSQPRQYTLFGRVEKIIENEDQDWDPIDTTRVADTMAGDQDIGVGDFIKMVQNVGEDLDVRMEDRHVSISGPTTIVDPIALYW